MATTRTIAGYTKRRLLQSLFCVVIPGFAFFVLLASGFSSADWRLWVGIVGFLACIGLGFVLSFVSVRRFRCPSCGVRAPHRWSEAGRLQFTCSDCDTVWETSLTRTYD
jgi:hypothetical protein